MLRYLSIPAVAFGVLANILATYMLAFAVTLVWSIILAGKGYSPAQLQELGQNPFDSISLTGSLLLAGAAADMIGGFVAARRSKVLEYWHALSAFIATFVLMSLIYGRPDDIPLWFSVVSILTGMAASLWGGRLAKLQKAAS